MQENKIGVDAKRFINGGIALERVGDILYRVSHGLQTTGWILIGTTLFGAVASRFFSPKLPPPVWFESLFCGLLLVGILFLIASTIINIWNIKLAAAYSVVYNDHLAGQSFTLKVIRVCLGNNSGFPIFLLFCPKEGDQRPVQAVFLGDVGEDGLSWLCRQNHWLSLQNSLGLHLNSGSFTVTQSHPDEPRVAVSCTVSYAPFAEALADGLHLDVESLFIKLLFGDAFYRMNLDGRRGFSLESPEKIFEANANVFLMNTLVDAKEMVGSSSFAQLQVVIQNSMQHFLDQFNANNGVYEAKLESVDIQLPGLPAVPEPATPVAAA